jgi:hypothetical protein
MSTKTKTNPSEVVGQIAQHVGLVLMTAAATVSMLDLPDKPKVPVTVSNSPAFAPIAQNIENTNPLRREREESAPHYISYNINQRTPSRAGKY